MRPYVVFGSNDDGETLVPLGIFEAPDHDAARKQARSDLFTAYGSCPVGNWEFGKLKVKEVVEIEEIQLPFPNANQLTVQDALLTPSRSDLGSGLGKGLEEERESE